MLKVIRESKELASMPVIMLSASAREEDVLSAYEGGANSYVQKPLDFNEFQEALGLIREYWGKLTKLPHQST